MCAMAISNVKLTGEESDQALKVGKISSSSSYEMNMNIIRLSWNGDDEEERTTFYTTITELILYDGWSGVV
jgi:hypothetical protein